MKQELAILITIILTGPAVFTQATTSKNFTIVAFGDSITAPRKGVVTYSDVMRERLKDKKVDVINAGIGGNTTEHARKRFETDVLAHSPDLVIMQFGNNDSAVDVWKDPPATQPRVPLETYIRNLRAMIDVLRSRGSRVILVTPLPTRWTEKLKGMYGKPPYDPADPNGFNFMKKEYVAALKSLAAESKIPLVDLYSEYFKFGRNSGRSMDALFTDGMHPNDEGHRMEADLLLKEIKKLKLGI
ncbi:MAG: SGNH/GDSL hydrolase family protein [Pyrinomonadaceae bacterium]